MRSMTQRKNRDKNYFNNQKCKNAIILRIPMKPTDETEVIATAVPI